jgi:hypothetical protein
MVASSCHIQSHLDDLLAETVDLGFAFNITIILPLPLDLCPCPFHH